MQGDYFSGFTFTQPVYKDFSPASITERLQQASFVKEVQPTGNLTREGTIHIEDLLEVKPFLVEMEIVPNVRGLVDVLPEFKKTLYRMGEDLGQRLTMRKRRLLLVDETAIKPETPEAAQRLVDRYGEYMREGGGGDCSKLSDGSYLLRVVAYEAEGRSSLQTVLETAAHEYGHSLSPFLESPADEEMKGYAFASLFQTFYEGESAYVEQRDDLHPEMPHDVAIHRLGELLRAGIPELAILAHLIGKRFGNFGPNDYLLLIGSRS